MTGTVTGDAVGREVGPDGATVAAGPLRLDVPVRDAARARALYADLLGARVVAGPDADRPVIDLRLPPGLGVRLGVADGPRLLTVATPRLDAVAAACAETGLATVTTGDAVTVTDPRFGGGELRFVDLATAADEAIGGPGPDPVAVAPGTVRAVGLRRVDHVCFAVPDLRPGQAVLTAAGGRPVLGGDGPGGGRALVMRFDGMAVEMLAPYRDDAIIARFLARRDGRSGIHHLTAMVADVTAAVAALDAVGIPTVDTDATTRPTWHETFLRPNATDGLLIQLARTDIRHDATLTSEQLDDVHAGRIVAVDYTMRRGGTT